MIEDIEHLYSELKTIPLSDSPVLHDREIDVLRTRLPDDPPAKVPEAAGSRQCERSRIEKQCLIVRILDVDRNTRNKIWPEAGRGRHSQHSGVRTGNDLDGRAILERADHVELPVSENVIGN